MPRNTIERELLIDSFDNEIAFIYAYRHQEVVNDHLTRLSALASEISQEAQADVRLISLPGTHRDGIHYFVINGLQRAARSDSPVDENADFGWRHTPADWDYKDLVRHLHFQMDGPWMLLNALSAKLETALPQSIKTFASLEQVLAVAFEVLYELDTVTRCPVHMPSIAAAMHALFVERHSNSAVDIDVEKALQNALEHYRNLALRAGVNMIYDQFCQRMLAKFISRAKMLDISIANSYPWGALIAQPRSVLHILIDFVSLINEDRTWYKKWRPERVKSEYLQKTQFDEFLFRGAPKVEPRSASGPIYFSSERTKLTLEGVPLQNRLIMVLPYDRPYPELKQALSRFEKYFLRRSATHRADLGDSGAREHEHDMRQKSVMPEPKVERVIVERVTSIPMHLAALRSFEQDRPEEENKPKTSLIVNIHTEFMEFGFDLRRDAIEEALDKAAKYRDLVMNKLDHWSK